MANVAAKAPCVIGQHGREEDRVRSVGRLLQIVGLGLPAVAILMQITDRLSVGKMLVLAVAALSLFYIGRILEGYARR